MNHLKTSVISSLKGRKILSLQSFEMITLIIATYMSAYSRNKYMLVMTVPLFSPIVEDK